ncbi:hypothetical protein Aazo_4934 ['Nostoc azollae' 0708]|jgi:hypothetical protein|uniref:Uncharacterized protein n=1 Tax=Nostoc azollae (strain 0708) TaxID=551115 RepID=D7DZ46_NOSA0|nr:hypothetical protein Aazo_4934 ['Nostoc azollae' 0708]
MLGSREKGWQQIFAFLGFGLIVAPTQSRCLTFDLVADKRSDTLDKPLTCEIYYSVISKPHKR